jgi:hypothetical protein
MTFVWWYVNGIICLQAAITESFDHEKILLSTLVKTVSQTTLVRNGFILKMMSEANLIYYLVQNQNTFITGDSKFKVNIRSSSVSTNNGTTTLTGTKNDSL